MLPALDATDFAERRERAREAMRASGLDALLLEPGPSMEYFTGVEWGRSERSFLLLLFAEGDPLWICPAFEERRARERIPSDHFVETWEEDASPFALAAGRFPSGVVVGIEPSVRSFIPEGIRAARPELRLVPGAEAVRRCRMIKSEKELALLRRANEITKRCIDAAFETVREGMTERDLSAAVRDAHAAAGMSGPWALVLFGPNAAFPHGTKNARRLSPGDVALVDAGGSLHGYQSDVTRTRVLGEPGVPLRRAFETVYRAQEEAAAAVRPGRGCSEIDAVARAVVEAAGFGSGYETFTHRLGHGIGLEGHEEPYLVRGNSTVLRPGITFSIEPGIYVPGEFGVRLEDIFAVTSSGAERLGPASSLAEISLGA
jgi:Xaa-Pro dipeptidase